MKLNWLSSFALSSLFAIAASGAPQTFHVQPGASEVRWTGTKVGGGHTGLVPLESGSLVMDGKALKSGAFAIEVSDLSVTDLSGGQKSKLEGHLKSGDFFAVDKHPAAKMVIASAEPGDKAGTYRVKGDLTIKGITEPVEFLASIDGQGAERRATAKLVFDRSKHDIRFRSGSFFQHLGDKLIHDEVELAIDLKLVAAK